MVHLIALLTFVSSLSMTLNSWAWGDRGHEIVGDIAESMVAPATLDFIRGILGVEPLSVAAIFPDKVRDDDIRFAHRGADGNGSYDFSGFHICDVPQGEKVEGEEKLSAKNSYSAILNASLILKDTSTKYPREAKMLALRYLVHIVGDIHQPLHIGNGLDLGGNSCLIKDGTRNRGKMEAESLPNLNFHSFWDDGIIQHFGAALVIGEEKPPRYLSDYRKLLRTRFSNWFTPDMKDKMGAGTPLDWINESLKLRESGIYPGDTIPVTLERAKSRPYCRYKREDGTMSDINSSQIPILDQSYLDRFVIGPEAPVATQLLKAGLRLAKILDDIAADEKMKQEKQTILNNLDQTKILESVIGGLSNSKGKPKLDKMAPTKQK